MHFEFEPIVCLRGQASRVLGYEMLFRGFPVDRNKLFLKIDEALDMEVFRYAIFFLRNLFEHGEIPFPTRFFVNIKPTTLIKYSEEVKKLIEDVPFPVVLEIREDFLEDVQLKELQKVTSEFLISLDDFGRGGSNIDRVVTLNPHFVKLDLDVFRNMPSGALIMLSEALREICPAKLVLEKVETEKDLALARMCRIDYGQGWLWSRKR